MHKRIMAGVVTALVLGGCATEGQQPSEHQRATAGAVIGAVTGAIVGHQVDRDKGAVVGGVLGGVAGGVIGHQMDQQEREFKEALEAERRANAIEVERVREDLLKLTLENDVSFDFDSARIKPAFRSSLEKLADVMTKYDRTLVTIVGHTDSVGSDAYNQRLSERRAEAVAEFLVSQGVARARISTKGAGETQPRATNETEAGRQLNRRVEVFVQPQDASRP